MNRKRQEFLARNPDPAIPLYFQSGSFDLDTLCYYETTFKGGSYFVGLPYYQGVWNEDRLIFHSKEDVDFFVNWYEEAKGEKIKLEENA